MNDEPPPQALMPPALLLGALVAEVVLHFLAPLLRLAAQPWATASGAPVLLAGVVLNLWADRLFKQANTTVKPFAPSVALIEHGPFSVTRNPMYLGMALILAGVALALGTLAPWLVVPAFIWQVSQRFIEPEEHKLEETFGSRYREYRTTVRRWL